MRSFIRRVFSLSGCALTASVIVLATAGFGNAAGASTVRKPTLLEFIRSRAAVHASTWVRRKPLASFQRYGSAWSEARKTNRYLLYASDVTAAGVGSVKIFPGWIHGPNPPIIGEIDGLDNPAGLAIDKFGTLYVVQASQGAPVLVFPFLSTTPSLQLATEGFPASIAVSNDGTVFVGTAGVPGQPPEILTYAPGSSSPALHLSDLAGDAVGAVRVDARERIFYAADYIGYGNSLNVIAPWSQRLIVSLSSPPGDLDLDRSGNLVAETGFNAVQVFSQSGTSLRTLNVSGFQSLTLNGNDNDLYNAAGTIFKNAYPSGTALDSITTLGNDNTFGLATFPAAPLPR